MESSDIKNLENLKETKKLALTLFIKFYIGDNKEEQINEFLDEINEINRQIEELKNRET
jgi:hypothetical protein